MRGATRIGAGVAAILVAATAAGSATAVPASTSIFVDTAAWPTIAISVVLPGTSTARPVLFENGFHVRIAGASNVGRADAVAVAVDHSQSMRGAALRTAVGVAKALVSDRTRGDRMGVFAIASRATRTGALLAHAGCGRTRPREVEGRQALRHRALRRRRARGRQARSRPGQAQGDLPPHRRTGHNRHGRHRAGRRGSERRRRLGVPGDDRQRDVSAAIPPRALACDTRCVPRRRDAVGLHRLRGDRLRRAQNVCASSTRRRQRPARRSRSRCSNPVEGQ